MFFGKVKVMFRKGGVLYGELVKEREERSLYIGYCQKRRGMSQVVFPSSLSPPPERDPVA